MKKAFSTKYYCSSDKGKTTLMSYRDGLTPGNPFLPDSEADILLAGGFESISPDSEVPLSPTLQLQADLTAMQEKELLQVAEAELFRFESMQWSSYQVELDPRVCVIAGKAALTEKFIDTFGGVLDIQPLLLEDSHPEFPNVVSLSVSSTGYGCRIDYQQRSPINKELCTYCGECGSICPEDCISTHLFIDYSKCTHCKECEKICEVGAIDIHGVMENVVNVPAVILLGDVEPDLPEDTRNIFRDTQLPQFFSTLYTAEIKEVVCHNNSICQYSGRLGTGCSRCISSCRHGALSRGKDGIRINHLLCEECGSCVAVCPTGAMQNGYFTDETLLNYLEKYPAANGKSDLVIGDSQALHQHWWRNRKTNDSSTCYIEYPLPQTLSWFQLLLLFATGFRRVFILDGQPSYTESTISLNAAKANAVIHTLFSIDNTFVVGSSQIIENVIDEPSSPHPLTIFFKSDSYPNRRFVLSNILKLLLMASSNTIDKGVLTGDYFSLECLEEDCTQCLACLNECKTGALMADDSNLTISYEAGLCVGCGICTQVCPEKVLTMSPCHTLELSYFTRSQMAKAEPAVCKECGVHFGSKKSLEKVLQILSARETVNQEHFQYCSTCRVKNLFEVQTS